MRMFLSSPGLFHAAQSAAAVYHTDDRVPEIRVTREEFERVERSLSRLAESQARSEKRLDRVEATLERLAEAQARTEEELATL